MKATVRMDQDARKDARTPGQQVNPGDILYLDGKVFRFEYATRLTEPGKSGKVLVTELDTDAFADGKRRALYNPGELYAHIFGLVIGPDTLPESAIGETKVGYAVIDQRGDVVLAHRVRDGRAEYAVWRLGVAWDGSRMFSAGDYYSGQHAAERAVSAFMVR